VALIGAGSVFVVVADGWTESSPTEFSVWVDSSADPPCLGVAGELDLNTCAPFRHALEELIRTSGPRISLDFRQVTFMGSTGLREFSRLLPQLEDVEIRNPQPVVRRVLELAGLGPRLHVTDS
jgi:anti-anti-sigma factor